MLHIRLRHFVWLLGRGRELEFTLDSHACFASAVAARDRAILTVDGETQCFPTITAMLEHGMIEGRSLLERWPETKLGALF